MIDTVSFALRRAGAAVLPSRITVPTKCKVDYFGLFDRNFYWLVLCIDLLLLETCSKVLTARTNSIHFEIFLYIYFLHSWDVSCLGSHAGSSTSYLTRLGSQILCIASTVKPRLVVGHQACVGILASGRNCKFDVDFAWPSIAMHLFAIGSCFLLITYLFGPQCETYSLFRKRVELYLV